MHVGDQKTHRHHGGASGPANHTVLGIKPAHPYFFGTFCHYVIFILKHQTGIHTFFHMVCVVVLLTGVSVLVEPCVPLGSDGHTV